MLPKLFYIRIASIILEIMQTSVQPYGMLLVIWLHVINLSPFCDILLNNIAITLILIERTQNNVLNIITLSSHKLQQTPY